MFRNNAKLFILKEGNQNLSNNFWDRLPDEMWDNISNYIGYQKHPVAKLFTSKKNNYELLLNLIDFEKRFSHKDMVYNISDIEEREYVFDDVNFPTYIKLNESQFDGTLQYVCKTKSRSKEFKIYIHNIIKKHLRKE